MAGIPERIRRAFTRTKQASGAEASELTQGEELSAFVQPSEQAERTSMHEVMEGESADSARSEPVRPPQQHQTGDPE